MTPLAAALLLSLVHLGAGQLDFLSGMPRSRTLSFASGVAIAFAFVDLLPAVAASGRIIADSPAGSFSFLERHTDLLGLAGLAMFYGLERVALGARRPSRARADGTAAGPFVYWLHIFTFALYNALLGFVLVHQLRPGERHPTLFALALAMHALVNDVGLREHHKRHYAGFGRWVLVLSPLVGWGVAQRSRLSDVAMSTLLAFLVGAVIVNTLKEELPAHRQPAFWAFLVGILVYSFLSLVW